MLACVSALASFLVAGALSALLVALWANAYGVCRACGEGRREPVCGACKGGGDPNRPVFNDPLSRRRRGDK